MVKRILASDGTQIYIDPNGSNIIAGRPANPQDYDPLRAEMWADLLIKTREFPGGMPEPAPGSQQFPCHICDIQVWLGPFQQEHLDKTDDKVSCWICMTMVVAVVGDYDVKALSPSDPGTTQQ